VVDRGATSAEMVRLVDRGLDEFVAGSFVKAQATLRSAVQQLQRNPAVTVVDPASTGALFKALIGLAQSQARVGDAAGSIATMTELVRAFPAQEVRRADYGPEPEQIYRDAQARIRSMERGGLSIAAREGTTKIFVDGQLRGTGNVVLGDLLPGRYRVFAQGGSEGVQYEVPVRSGEDSALDIDVPVDTVLTVSEAWVGFMFASDTERARELSHAATLARRWGCASIALVATTVVHGEPRVTATLVNDRGEVIRSGMIATSGGDEARQRSLARFIADGTPSPEVTDVAKAGSPRDAGRRRSSVVSKGLIGLGIAGIAAGVVLVVIDEDVGNRGANDNMTPGYWETAPFGIAAGIAGLAAIGVGVWMLREEHASAPVVSVTRSGGFIGWSARF
jgi:hypothetical protein